MVQTQRGTPNIEIIPTPEIIPTENPGDESIREDIRQSSEPVVFSKEKLLKVSRSTIDATLVFNLDDILSQFDNLEGYINDFIKDARQHEYAWILNEPYKPTNYSYITRHQYWNTAASQRLHGECERQSNLRVGVADSSLLCKLMKQYQEVLANSEDLKELFVFQKERFYNILDLVKDTEPTPTNHQHLRQKRALGDYLATDRNFKGLSMHEQRYITTLLVLLETKQEDKPQHILAAHEMLRRKKRFDIFSIFLGWNAWSNSKTIKRLKQNLARVQKNVKLTRAQLMDLANQLNMSITFINRNTKELIDLNLKLFALNQTMVKIATDVRALRLGMTILGDVRNAMFTIRTGILMMENNIRNIEELLRVMATHKANPLLLHPTKLKELLAKIQDRMEFNPRLQLPEDPTKNIWVYYQFMSIMPIVMRRTLIVIITIPLLDSSLQVDLYRAYSLPALHPALGVEFKYQLENSYIGIHKDGMYAILPSADEVQICKASQGYYCYFRQALYPTQNNQWCIYALFTDNKTAIEINCKIQINPRYQDEAINLKGFLWAVSLFKDSIIHIRCLTDNSMIQARAPLEIIEVPNGCEATTDELHIPARSELTIQVDGATFVMSILKFTAEWSGLQNVHVWLYLDVANMDDVPEEKKQQVANDLTLMPAVSMKLLSKKLAELHKYPFMISAKVILAIMIVFSIAIIVGIGFVVWQVKRNLVVKDILKTGKLGHASPLLSKVVKFVKNKKKNKRGRDPEEEDSSMSSTIDSVDITIENPKADTSKGPSKPPRSIDSPLFSFQKTTSGAIMEEIGQAKEIIQKEIEHTKTLTPSVVKKAAKRMAAKGYTVNL